VTRQLLEVEVCERPPCRSLSEVEADRLATVRVACRRLPVELVVAIAEILKARVAGILFDLVKRAGDRARQAADRHTQGGRGEIQYRHTEVVRQPPFQWNTLAGLGNVHGVRPVHRGKEAVEVVLDLLRH
jgi:hypothetical protein